MQPLPIHYNGTCKRCHGQQSPPSRQDNLLYVWSDDLHEQLLYQVHVDVDVPNHHTEVANRRCLGISCQRERVHN